MQYQVSNQTSLLHQKRHTNGADYVMQISKCINLQIIRYGKNVPGHHDSILQGIKLIINQ